MLRFSLRETTIQEHNGFFYSGKCWHVAELWGQNGNDDQKATTGDWRCVRLDVLFSLSCPVFSTFSLPIEDDWQRCPDSWLLKRQRMHNNLLPTVPWVDFTERLTSGSVGVCVGGSCTVPLSPLLHIISHSIGLSSFSTVIVSLTQNGPEWIQAFVPTQCSRVRSG